MKPEEILTKAEKRARKREADGLGRKIVEEHQLKYFTDAYQFSLGDTLDTVSWCEGPDFICQRSNGDKVGVELTQVVGDPSVLKTCTDPEELMDGFAALEEIHNLIETKEFKRRQSGWRLPENTILVLQLMDYNFREGDSLVLDELDINELPTHGFKEIWLGDYSRLDAYGDIELFCCFPEYLWGFYERWNPGRKPYG